jgi:hypothetical protein
MLPSIVPLFIKSFDKLKLNILIQQNPADNELECYREIRVRKSETARTIKSKNPQHTGKVRVTHVSHSQQTPTFTPLLCEINIELLHKLQLTDEGYFLYIIRRYIFSTAERRCVPTSGFVKSATHI